MIETVVHNGELLAMIVRREFRQPGVHFFTTPDLSQQLAYMQHAAGTEIAPHVHNPVPREVHFTQEVLLLRRGRMRVDFYSSDRTYLESRELSAGDIILLATGGHGFHTLEDVEMFEVKQGPYASDNDKTRFAPVAADQIRMVTPKQDS